MVRAGANPDPRKEASSQQKLEHQFIFDTRLPGNFFLYGFRVWGVGLAGGSRVQGFGFWA